MPKEWAGERVDLLWVSHSEATLWIDGRSIQGLNTSPDGARPDALLLDPAAGGERLELRVELACNGMFGQLPRPYESLEPVVLDRCQIARFDAARGSCTTTSTCCARSRPTGRTGSTRPGRANCCPS